MHDDMGHKSYAAVVVEQQTGRQAKLLGGSARAPVWSNPALLPFGRIGPPRTGNARRQRPSKILQRSCRPGHRFAPAIRAPADKCASTWRTVGCNRRSKTRPAWPRLTPTTTTRLVSTVSGPLWFDADKLKNESVNDVQEEDLQVQSGEAVLQAPVCRDTCQNSDEQILQDAMAKAEEERTSLLCGEPRARAAALAVLQRHLDDPGCPVCPGCRKPLCPSLEVRDLRCDGPCGRDGSQTMALARCEPCDFAACMHCISRFIKQPAW